MNGPELPRLTSSRLGGRFARLIAAILVLTMGTVAYLQYRNDHRQSSDALQSSGMALGGLLAAIAVEPMLTYDFVSLDEHIRDATEQENVVYAIVLSSEGRAVTSYLDPDSPFIARASMNADSSGGTAGILKELETEPAMLHLSIPIEFSRKRLGTIYLGLDRSRSEALARRQFIDQIIFSMLIILVLTACITVVFRYKVLAPVVRLVNGAQAVADSKLDTHVEVSGDDELASLANAFNDMTGKLRQAMGEKSEALEQLRTLNATLEQRVEARTKESERLNHELAHQAMHDPLTGLPNRNLIMDGLHHAIIRARRDNRRFSLLILDLDRFKEINDTLGHHIGDFMLMDIGHRLLTQNKEGTLGRLGGDEFAVILPDFDVTGASRIARKLLQSLLPPVEVDGHNLSISGSIGIAVYPDHGEDEATLLRHCDTAMYESKRSPEGFAVYNEETDSHTVARLALMADLRNAIKDDQLQLYYQPIVYLGTGQVAGVEALCRWQHPVRGYVPPDEFVALAEHTGMIKPLTDWVLETACKHWERRVRAGSPLPFSVNLSVRNLQDPELIGYIEGLIRDYRVESGMMTLEITEGAFMDDLERVLGILTRLGEQGVRFSIDDFGTGFSSLSYLKRLPVHEVKIDRSFVMHMVEDHADANIVRSIIDLAQNLGLSMVAEGVETREIASRLAGLGCTKAQGYYFARPVPGHELDGSILEIESSSTWLADAASL